MKGDERVVSYLNKALRHELAAVNQYWLHYRLQLDWGYAKIAKKSRAESIEEMHHADQLIDRIIFLEGFPNLQQIDPLRIGETLKETLECDLAGEQSARALYREAREVCREHGDFVSKALFDDLLADEEGHIDFLESQLSLMADIGEQNYGLLNATSADKSEG